MVNIDSNADGTRSVETMGDDKMNKICDGVFTWTNEPEKSKKEIAHRKNVINFLEFRLKLAEMQMKMDRQHLELLKEKV